MTSIVRHALLIALALGMLYPVIWMVVSSLRPNDEIFRDPSIIPDSFEISNYVDGWNALAYPFNVYMWNSALIVIGCIIGNLVSCSMAAYAFARLQFNGKRFWFAVMLLSIMLPIHVIIVPQYVLFSAARMDQHVPAADRAEVPRDRRVLHLPDGAVHPRHPEGARRGGPHRRRRPPAHLPADHPAADGAGARDHARSSPSSGRGTTSSRSSSSSPSPSCTRCRCALRSFEDAQSTTNYAQMFAMSVVSLIPIFLIFLFGQKFLIKGIATTGIK